jgi:SAM-dependent methyltransferase
LSPPAPLGRHESKQGVGGFARLDCGAVPTAASRCHACDGSLAGARRFQGVDRLHGTLGAFDVLICARCGSGTTHPLAAPHELAALYPQTYGPYEAADGRIVAAVSAAIRWWQGRRALTRAPLAAIRDQPPGSLIDVGCGRGDLAALFVRRGWRATGIEPSAAAVEVARSQGVDARVGTLADVPVETGAYDAVVFQHSLEHTLEPVRDLERVRAALRPGGRVLVTVPNFACWQRRRFRDRWYHLDLPRHRTHFSPAGLSIALERSGLRAESITTSTSTVGLPATVQYALAGRCLFPDGLRLRIAAGLCVLGLPVARLLDRLGGGGDQLHAVARRATASSTSAATASAGRG